MPDQQPQVDPATATGSQTAATAQTTETVTRTSTLPDDPAILKTEIEKLRSESADRRVKNKTLETELQTIRERQAEIEKAQQIEQGRYKELFEKTERESTEKIKLLMDLRKKDALRAAALEAGILDSDLVNLIPTDKIDPNTDAISDARNVVAEFRITKPHLFKSVGSAPVAASTTNAQATPFTPMPGAVTAPSATEPAPFNAMTATKEEASKALNALRKQLGAKMV